VALFEDETDLLLFPPLEAAWGKRGVPTPVPISGFNARRVCFGAIALSSGHRVVQIQERQRAENFCDFLEYLRWCYRGWYLLLLLDSDRSHTAFASLQVADELEIELDFLPKRAPELNGMDHLFRHGKRAVSTNHQYPNVDEHAARFLHWMLALSPQQALTQAGICSEHFWLRDCLPYLQ
jgi:transposase